MTGKIGKGGHAIADAWQILRGSLINLSGFLLRSGGRIPFIFFAALLYGAGAVGQFAAIAVVIQIAAAVSVFGMRRSLYDLLNRAPPEEEAKVLVSGLALSLAIAVFLAGFIALFAGLFFSTELIEAGAIWLVPAIPMIAASEILLVGTRHRNVLRYHVMARSIAEPWMLSLLSAAIGLLAPTTGGLLLSYAGANFSAFLVAAIGFHRCVLRGRRESFSPALRTMATIVRRSSPTAVVDIVENLFRRLDVFILSIYAPSADVGVYYLARQIALLVQNVKQAFDPILEPVIARLTIQDGIGRAAQQLNLVSRWIFTVQFALVVALTVPATPLLGLLGEDFESGGLVLALLLAAELIGGSAAPWELTILYTRRQLNLLCSAVGLAVFAGLCLLLSGRFGAVGAASAFLAGLCTITALRLLIAKTVLGANPLPKELLKPVIAGGTAVLAGWAVFKSAAAWPPGYLVGLTVAAALAAYALMLRIAGFEEADRTLFGVLRGRLRNRKG